MTPSVAPEKTHTRKGPTMPEVEVTTADGRRWMVDQAHLSLPDDMTPTEEVRAAAAKLRTLSTMSVPVRADLLVAWLDGVIHQQGLCCDLTHPCMEHEKALDVARYTLGREAR